MSISFYKASLQQYNLIIRNFKSDLKFLITFHFLEGNCKTVALSIRNSQLMLENLFLNGSISAYELNNHS